MRATGTFSVVSFVPAPVETGDVSTALPVGVATMEKRFSGEIEGRATTVFTSAFDQERGAGTYVAMESFEGSVAGRKGALNFVHSASTSGQDRSGEYFILVPASGTGELAGITGVGGIAVDADGTHRIWFDYELPEQG